MKVQTSPKERLDSKLAEAEELVKTTGMPGGIPNAPDTVLENLLKECEEFLRNCCYLKVTETEKTCKT